MQINDGLIKKVHKAKSLVALTAVFSAMLVLADIWLLVQTVRNAIPYALGFGLFGIITATVAVAYSYAPMSIALSRNALILSKGIGVKRFCYSDIAVIDLHTVDGPAVRVCGIGGVFGFVGRYYNRSIGSYFSYVGDYAQTFLVELKNGKKYLLSCEDRESVVSFVKKKIA